MADNNDMITSSAVTAGYPPTHIATVRGKEVWVRVAPENVECFKAALEKDFPGCTNLPTVEPIKNV